MHLHGHPPENRNQSFPKPCKRNVLHLILTLNYSITRCTTNHQENQSPLITDVSSKIIRQKKTQNPNNTLKVVNLNSRLDLFKADKSKFENTDEIIHSIQEGKLYSVFFEKVHDLTLSRSKFQITSFVDFEPYVDIFKKLKRYSLSLQYDVSSYAELKVYPPQDLVANTRNSYLNEIFNQLLLISTQVNEDLIKLESEFNDTLMMNEEQEIDVTPQKRRKRSFISKAFKWLFGGNDESATIKQLKSNIKILFENQKLHSTKMQEALNFNNLTRIETRNNRKLIRQVGIDIAKLKKTIDGEHLSMQILIADKNIMFAIIQFRNRLSILQSNTQSLRENLKRLYSQLVAFTNHRLTPEIMNVKDLRDTLNTITDTLKSHPKLKLPIDHTNKDIWKYYGMTQIDSLFYKNKLFTLITFPLVEKDRIFHVYQVYNLPLVHPALKKKIKYKLNGDFMAISDNLLYIAYPTNTEIFNCQLSAGSFCELKTPLYAIDSSQHCMFYLYRRDESNIDKYCKVDFVNQTLDEAIALDDTHWITSILRPTKLHISCLTTTSYIQLKVPLQIVELKQGCEAFTSNMLITPMNNIQIKTNKAKSLNTNLASRLTNLRYSSVRDFTSMKGLTVANLTDDELKKIADKFPEITDVTIPELNQKLNAINEVYPYEFPLWAIIALTVLATVVIIICATITIACRHRGKCKVERYFTKRKPKTFESVKYTPPSKHNLKQEDSNTSPRISGEIEIQHCEPKFKKAPIKPTPVTPTCVKNILQRDYNIDFTRYDRKMSEVM